MKTEILNNILLVTVTKVEAAALLSACKAVTGRASETKMIGGRIYHSLGSVEGLNLLMVQSEMGTSGPGAALLTVYDGINALSPTAVIMVGIAFGVDHGRQKIGDILVSQKIQSYEPQRVGTSVRGAYVVARGDRATASTRLLNWFRAGDLTWKGAPVRFGLILSGEKLVDNRDFRNQLIEMEPEAIGGEMEGAGLYAAAQNSKTEWILVKAISDWADGKRDTDRIALQETAARNAAEFVLHVLSQRSLGRTRFPIRRAFLVPAAAVAIVAAAMIIFRECGPPVLPPYNAPKNVTPTTSEPGAGRKVEHPELLSEEQIRTAITTALQNGQVATAIGYLHYIREGDSKQEECQRVFGFCIANHKLEDADTVVNLCWRGQDKDERLRQIQQERLKQ